MTLPVPADQDPTPPDPHPVATDPRLPPGSRIEFLLFGFTAPDGGVQVYASRDVTMVEIATEWPDEMADWLMTSYLRGPRRHTVTAHLREYAVATGDTMRDAVGALADYLAGR